MSRKEEDREALSRSNECLKWHNHTVTSIYHPESARSQPFWVTLGPIAEFPFEPKATYVEFSSLKRRFRGRSVGDGLIFRNSLQPQANMTTVDHPFPKTHHTKPTWI